LASTDTFLTDLPIKTPQFLGNLLVGQPVRRFVHGAAAWRHIRRRAYGERKERRIDSAEIVSSSSWSLVAVLLVPALLFLIVAWQDRRLVFDDTERDVLRTVDIFEQHARNVFQTHSLVATQIDERIRGMGWDEIAKSEELHQYLESISRRYPQAESLWLLDSVGMVRNSSLVLPQKPINAADEDFFIELRKGDADDFVSRPAVGKVRGLVHFNLARRRTRGTKDFDGVIAVTVHPTYFIQFWRSVVSLQDQPAIALVRADGTVLAREPFPHYEAPKLGPESRFMREIGRTPAGGAYRAVSALDGIERFFAYRKIDGFPVYVGYGVAVRDAAAVWHKHLVGYGSFFAIATLGLAAIAAVAMRHARRAADALDDWRATSCELAAEAERHAATEDQLRQAQKMEALGQMTGGLAHDLNNILSIIAGNLELLRPKITDARSVQLMKRALTAVESAEKSVTSLLSFARRQPLRSERFDLNNALQGMDGLMHQALGPKINLETRLSPYLWQVEADLNQTGLAVLNIIVNARDAMPEGGSLQIKTANQVLNGELDDLVGSFVALTFADTGSGIAPDLLLRVFEPFFTTKEPGKGTGLGLSMVYGFAKQSRGSVSIRSIVGQGTTITLYLPRASAAA
jgi:two-component system NtrC family sensor kinase